MSRYPAVAKYLGWEVMFWLQVEGNSNKGFRAEMEGYVLPKYFLVPHISNP